MGDMDDDADIDVIVASDADSTIWWVENTDGTALSWNEEVIFDEAEGVTSVHAGDFDGNDDGSSVDVLAGYSDKISWFERETWNRNTVYTRAMSVQSVIALDLDDDGW